MELFPAIDILDGRAVRLLHGNYDRMTVYSDDPLAVALSFKRAGAKFLHLVDLDGAKDGDTPNYELIKRITSESGLLVEIGGGVRNSEVVKRYLDAGAMRVIIGTAAVTDPDFLKAAVVQFGDKVAVGVDIKDGYVATHGWIQTSNEDCFGFCEKLQSMGVQTLICTDISRDGAMLGVNEQLYEQLCCRFSMDIIASGGVTITDDLVRLSKTGVKGAILGKSLYAGSIDLGEALDLLKKSEER